MSSVFHKIFLERFKMNTSKSRPLAQKEFSSFMQAKKARETTNQRLERERESTHNISHNVLNSEGGFNVFREGHSMSDDGGFKSNNRLLLLQSLSNRFPNANVRVQLVQETSHGPTKSASFCWRSPYAGSSCSKHETCFVFTEMISFGSRNKKRV